MSKKDLKELRRILAPLGAIKIEMTKNNHLKLTHVASGATKFFSKTPSDYRSALNMISQFRHAIRARQQEGCRG